MLFQRSSTQNLYGKEALSFIHKTNPETMSWARGYNTFSNSVEHEILNTHKYKKCQEIWLFFGSDNLRMLFLPLPNVKMPTIVGILTFMSRKKLMLN